ncbi:MAG: MFS transporter [Gammaproteobacteria bacterium]|nr:MFS transporter [Gammaproteobacteria bacterium]
MTTPSANLAEPQEITRLGLSLFVILSGSFLAPLLMHSSTLAIPAIATELSLTAETISWFTLVQVLGNVCFVLPAGKLADKFGRKRIFCFGLLIAGLACFVGGGAQSGMEIVICRALQGIGGAFIFASAVALVMSVPPEEDKPRVMGIYISIAYMGIVTGPIFGGLVIDNLDWRWVFYVPGIAMTLIGFIGFALLHWERYGDPDTRLRPLDIFLYMASLSLIAVGIFDTSALTGQALLAGGILSFTAFFWFQTKRRNPLLEVNLFLRNRTFAILGTAHLLLYSGLLALPFALTLYFQFIKGLDAQTTGYILLVQALCTAVVAPFNGWASARFRPRYLIFAGMILMLAAAFMLALLEMQTPVSHIIVALVLVGSAVGVMDASIIHTCMSSVEERLLGSASATLNGLRIMGGFVGIGVISFLMDRHLGEQEIEPHLFGPLMSVFQQFFLVFAILAVLAMLLLVVGVLTRPKQTQISESAN